jgi:hypothetical protein
VLYPTAPIAVTDATIIACCVNIDRWRTGASITWS